MTAYAHRHLPDGNWLDGAYCAACDVGQVATIVLTGKAADRKPRKKSDNAAKEKSK